jgi:hypothetical protein
LAELEAQVNNVIGPDNKKQSCNKNTDGEMLIQMYQSRLNLAMGSRFEIKPYQVVITDLDLNGFCGFQVAEKIQMMFLDAI